MLVAEALKTVDRDPLASLYLLGGEERFWGREWLNRLVGRLSASGPVERSQFEGKIDWPMILERLALTGFFASQQLLVIVDGQWAKKEESLKQYLQKPYPQTTLVLWEKKIAPALQRAIGPGRTIELKLLFSGQLLAFIAREAELRAVSLSRAAQEWMAQHFAQDGDQVRHELEKMRLYDAQRVWQPEDLEGFSRPLERPHEIWGLTDAILSKQSGQAMAELDRALEEGKAPVMIVVVIARLVAQMLHALDARSRGLGLADFQRQEGVAPFVARKLWQALSRWRRDELSSALSRAEFFDHALKSGHGQADVWLSLLVVELTGT